MTTSNSGATSVANRWDLSVPIPADGQTDETVFVYARVSTAEQAKKGSHAHGFSIPGQIEACRAFADRYGWRVEGEYRELGRTGRNMDRPELQAMLRDAAEKRPTYVLIYDLSRLSRDEVDGLIMLRTFEKHQTMIRSTIEPFDYGPNGLFLFNLFMGQAALRSRGDGTKVKGGMQRRHAEGGTNGPAPPGYLNVQKTVDGRRIKTVDIDPEQGALLQLGWNLMASGTETVGSIRTILNEMGYRTRATPMRPSKPLGRTSLYKAFRNPYYAGWVVQNGVTARGSHEPLVSQDIFDRVQAVLDANRQGCVRTKYKPHHLAGSLFCDKCGTRLGWATHRARNGSQYEYFSCLSRSRPEGACGARYVSNDLAEMAVEQIHEHRWLSDDEVRGLRSAFRDHVAAKTEVAQLERARHERRYRELVAQQQKLVQLSFKNAISDEVLVAEQGRIEKEQADALKWKGAAEQTVETSERALEEALTLMTLPAKAYAEAEPSERRLINQAIFERVDLWLAPDDDVARQDEQGSSIDSEDVWEWHVPNPVSKSLVEPLVVRTKFDAVFAQIRSVARLVTGAQAPPVGPMVRSLYPTAH